MDVKLGEDACKKLIEKLDSIQKFSIYTGFKNAPVTWNPEVSALEEFCRFYPNFPGKPVISSPITREEFRDFCTMLNKHLNFSHSIDIITFEKQNDRFVMFAESFVDDNDELKKFTKEEVVKFLHDIMNFCRINIIESRNYNFDLRNHLAMDKKI